MLDSQDLDFSFEKDIVESEKCQINGMLGCANEPPLEMIYLDLFEG